MLAHTLLVYLSRQGCNLSPYLFNLYINDLCNVLDQANIDPVHLQDREISSLMYADDMLILSYTESGMQKALDILEEYCQRWQLVVNPDKTKIVIFNKRQMDINVDYMGIRLSVVSEYTYLGLKIHKSGSFMPAIKELQRKAQRAYFHTKAILKGDANPKLCLQLFDAMVKPILLYGSDVWGGFGHSKKHCENFISKILSKDLSPFENLHLRCCKDSLRLPKSSSNMGCRAELGRFPLIKDVIMNILKFDMRLQSVNNHDILKLAHVSQQRLGKNSQNTFTYYQLTNLLAGQLHMTPDTRLSIGHTSTQLKYKLKLFGKKISNKLENFYITNIFEPFILMKRKNELDKLHLYSQVKVDFRFEDYLNIGKVESFTRFRLSAHWLPIERGRYKKPIIPRDERLCYFCNTEVGNEFHALMKCNSSQLKSIRSELFPKIIKIDPYIGSLNETQQFYYLMKGSNMSLVPLVSKWTHLCNKIFEPRV